MANITIRRDNEPIELDVDIRTELEAFPWIRPRWDSGKLIAASPFRYDRTPSFFVSLEGDYAGSWKDSGSYDADFESGGFVKLLAFLRDETHSETTDYLLELYGVIKRDQEHVIKPFNLPKKRAPVTLAESELESYLFRHEYLATRGINERTQRFMGVGYNKGTQAITLPWRHANGALANVKFRKVRGKAFWYRKGAEPIRNLVYGIDKVYRHNFEEVYVCEAEIDALSVYSAGKPAVAIGGASVNQTQLNAIRKSPAKRVVIAVDNDKAGAKVKRQLIEGLRGYVELSELRLPDGVKDVNEALVAGTLDVENVSLVNSVRIKCV